MLDRGRPATTTPRRRYGREFAIAAFMALLALAAYRWLATPTHAERARSTGASTAAALRALIPHDAPADGAARTTLGVADGAVPDGTTVFDGGVPGVAQLDPELRKALQRAASDASAAGITFVVDSGWRSAAYQEQLRRKAVAEYGSAAEAARWVATGTTSAHVRGDAVDLGPDEARTWLAAHGAAYGLCRVYANEPWHFELRSDAIGSGCPAVYADPTHDPRMHQ